MHAFLHFFSCASLAPVLVCRSGVSVGSQLDDRPASGTPGGRVGWRVRHFLEVVLIGSIPRYHLRLECGTALRARFPITLMSFVEMIATEGESTVVSVAAVSGV